MSGCCYSPDYDGMRARWKQYQAQFSKVEHAITKSAFRTILTGNPLPVAGLADGSLFRDLPVQEIVGRMADAGLLTLSPDRDAITGAAGLSITPSRHRLLLDGTPLYTWCAFDAVGIPADLETPALVESRCAASRQPIRLEFQSGQLIRASHPDAVILVVPPESGRSICGFT